jgi:hypothetical protein
MDEKEFKELKEKHDAAQEEAAEARGALNSLKVRLREEFGVKDVKAARERLKELSRQSKTLRAEFDAALKIYKEKHEGV